MSYVKIQADGSAEFNFDGIQDKVVLDFMKTIKLAGDKIHGLPPGLGKFQLGYVEDKPSLFTEKELGRGGAYLELADFDAMWINFKVQGSRPFAIKVAAGKINATSGEPWANELLPTMNDYMEIPKQRWLDGFKREPGNLVNQFVAKTLGEGYTAEEQLTGKAEYGGLQIIVYPLKESVWQKMQEEKRMRSLQTRGLFTAQKGEEYCASGHVSLMASASSASSPVRSLGMGLGASIHQQIIAPELPLDAWDLTKGVRMFVHLKEKSAPKLKTIDELSRKSAAGKGW